MVSETPYDVVAEAYSRIFDVGGGTLEDAAFKALLADVRGQRVLSLACGQGRDARLLASLGAEVTGVDIAREMLGRARAHEVRQPRGITYLEGDAQALSLVDASFDGIACHMALMDIPNLRAAIGEVARVLNPGGWFVFSIVHPCYGPHVQIVSDYMLDQRYAKQLPNDALPTYAYHRPLADYVNELDANGLHLRRLIEVRHAADPGEGGVPGLLYARAEKR